PNVAVARVRGVTSGSVSRRARGFASYATTGVDIAAAPGAAPVRATTSGASVVALRPLSASRTDTRSVYDAGAAVRNCENSTLSSARAVSLNVATRTISA